MEGLERGRGALNTRVLSDYGVGSRTKDTSNDEAVKPGTDGRGSEMGFSGLPERGTVGEPNNTPIFFKHFIYGRKKIE